MCHEAAGVTTDVFPKTMAVGGVDCALSYHFEPNSPRDGVTLAVPMALLNQVPAEQCEWLVAGMIKPKVQALLKSLPQKLRKHCVPLPDFVDDFVAWAVEPSKSLIDALIEFYRLKTQQLISATDFKPETLPAHAFMNFKLLDEYGRQLEMSRNLSLLRTHFGGQARTMFQTAAPQSQSVEMSRPITSWDFGDLPELMELQKGGKKMFGYPALEAHDTHCELSVWDEESVARDVHRNGVLCLAKLQLKDTVKHLEKNIPDAVNMGMLYTGLTQDSLETLKSEIVLLALQRAANLEQTVPRDAGGFDAMVIEAKGRIGLIVQEVARLVLSVLTEWLSASKKVTAIKAYGMAYQDMTAQIEKLTTKKFISQTPYAQLVHYPRYFKAIVLRVDKLKNDDARDGQMMREMLPLIQNWQRAVTERGLDADLIQFRWLLEELRVGLFAQTLRTPMPVSVKRLYKIWESLHG